MEPFKRLLFILIKTQLSYTGIYTKLAIERLFDTHEGIIQTEMDVYMCTKFMKVLYLSRKKSMLRQDYEVKVIQFSW